MNLKQALTHKKPLLGTFLKTPHFHVAEVLSLSDLDVLCLDAEHAAYQRSDLDTNIMACRAQQKPVLVRIANDHHDSILNALDLGATGIVVPHVKTAEQLQLIVKNSFYGAAGRGYAGSTRAAGYTTQSIATNIEINATQTTVIAQIEDLEALDNIEEIAQVQGCDCLFIGRMDLTVALGETNPKADSVMAAVERVVDAANRHGATTGMFVGDLSELPYWIGKGVSLFLLGSDHGFMLAGAKTLRDTFDKALN